MICGKVGEREKRKTESEIIKGNVSRESTCIFHKFAKGFQEFGVCEERRDMERAEQLGRSRGDVEGLAKRFPERALQEKMCSSLMGSATSFTSRQVDEAGFETVRV
jgi:hypothetical protein